MEELTEKDIRLILSLVMQHSNSKPRSIDDQEYLNGLMTKLRNRIRKNITKNNLKSN